MGQVCGKTQSIDPVNAQREWISVESQEKRFHVHKAADVFLRLGNKYVKHELFDAQIAGMIAEYAAVDDNWAKACRLFGQNEVLAFPEEHMSEIGDPDSVFYFIPAGSLNEFEAKLRNFAHEVLGIQDGLDHPLKYRHFSHSARQQHGDIPNDAKWVSMKRELLEGSRNKSYKEQKELIAENGITIPSIQTVAKILFLDKALQLATVKFEALEETQDEEKAIKSEKTLFPVGTYTRVMQIISSDWHLSIGGMSSSGVSVHSLEMYFDFIGVAAVREF